MADERGSLQKIQTLVAGTPTVVTKIWPRTHRHDVVIVVIPGNPGVIDFYDEFIEALFLASGNAYPIYGVEHAGHSALEAARPSSSRKISERRSAPLSLKEQVDHKLAFLEEFIPDNARIILVGHSIGSYIILKMLRRSSRSEDILKAILLFPTIERMAVSPSGIYVTPMVNYFKWLVVFLAAVVSWLPDFAKNWLVQLWCSRRNIGPCGHTGVLKLLNSRSANACLTMARDEMADVVEADDEVIADNIHKLIFYYGATDHWAPVSYYRDIKAKFPKGEIHLCQRNYKHAFVLQSSKEVADLAWSWIEKIV